MNREEMIEWLVDDTISNLDYDVLNWVLVDIFTRGHVGFNNYTDDELRAEILERDPDELKGESHD